MVDKYQRLSIMFNTQTLKFKTGAETQGLDMAALDTATQRYLVDPFACYKYSLCTWYNQSSSSVPFQP